MVWLASSSRARSVTVPLTLFFVARRCVRAYTPPYPHSVITYTCMTTGTPFVKEYLYEPWMAATLWDFYTNTFVLLCWVWYREQSYVVRFFWTLMLIGLGSFGTTLYVFLSLYKIRNEKDPARAMKQLLLRKSSQAPYGLEEGSSARLFVS